MKTATLPEYRIICLQNAGFSSWDEPHTVSELLAKFWDYADNDGMFSDPQYTPYVTDYSTIPDWFTLDLIQDLWEVRFENVKTGEEL